MNPAFAEQYGDFETWHWWFQGRVRILSAVLRRELGAAPLTRIASVGGGPLPGLGWLVPFLVPGGRVIGVDADVRHARDSPDGCLAAAGAAEAIPLRAASCDLVLALDVIEHLDDDAAGLRECARVLRPGGLLVVTVPALPSLWGAQDIVSQHRRRYTRATLRDAFARAGLSPPGVTYFNSLLLPAIAAVRWARRLSPSGGPVRSDFEDARPGITNRLLGVTFGAESHLVGRVPLPVGASLLATARREPRGMVEGNRRMRRQSPLAGGRRQVVLGAVTGALWLAAELLRGPHVTIATLLSMGAWIVFLLQVLAWARRQTPWGTFTARAARMSALTLASLAVLLLYYVHSRIEETGIHVDAVYTYVGLQWFLELHNPITFAGATYSYYQFPLALLTHLPGVLLGFDKLGPFALNLGIMLTVALLLAIMTVHFAPSGIGVQLLVVALASAVFSNRLLVQSYQIVGYTIPAVCLGLMLLVVVDDESFPRPERMVGGLLALAVLHHLPGVMLVLPVAVAWLILRRHPTSKMTSFLADNPPLLTIAVVFVITLWVHPELLVRRVQDLTVGPAGNIVPPFTTKMRENWGYLTTSYPSEWVRSFVLDTRRSWYLVDLPPLGGMALPILAATWLCSAASVPGRPLRYLLHFGALAVLLLALSGLQHVLTDFSDYRDFTMIFALTVAGFLFVLRASRLEGTRKRVAWGLAIAIALYNYADLTQLRGRSHLAVDYAPRSQAVMERVRSISRQLGGQPFGAARAYVVLDNFFSMEPLYLDTFRRRGLPVSVMRTSTYCARKSAAIEQAAGQGCEAFLLFEDTESCEFRSRHPSVQGTLYDSACDATQRSGPRMARQVVP